MIRAVLICLVICMFQSIAYGQRERKEFLDSIYIYKRIEDFSSKRKFTQLLYSLVFRPITPIPQVRSKKKPTVKEKPIKLSAFEGKVIRNIQIVTYDPFGYSTKDTSQHPRGFVPKAGNALHIKTWPVKIKHIMIVKKYDTFDSLRIKESERLIRSQNFVREVFITPIAVKGDSVDLFIRVYDVWSIILTGIATTTSTTVNGKDKNFLGTGHQFEGSYMQNYVTGNNSYMANYIIPNIYSTYISSSLRYYADENRNYYHGLSLNRSFYSIFTSWAGGISLQRSLTREVLLGFDSTAFEQRYRSTSQDYWLGRSWQLFRGKTEDRRSTSFISSARYMRLRYQERASEAYDSLRAHSDEELYLVGIGLSRRQYKQDNYIFKYGFTEDVPTGRSYSLIGGYQMRDSVPRWYGGARIYMANYHNWGYFNLYMEYGTFFHKKQKEQGCYLVGINYFSNIIRLGRWKLRQFIKQQYTIGFDRLKHEKLSLNDDAGIRGFNSLGLSGTQRFTLTFQLQSYAPWNVLGFRFGPYLVCSFGMLGSEKTGFSGSPLYSSYGIGLLVKNDYLILNQFQISIAFYPSIPGVANNVLKMNPVKTTDFGFRGFDISQPSIVGYQ